MKKYLVFISLLLTACILLSACNKTTNPNTDGTLATTAQTTVPVVDTVPTPEGYFLNGQELSTFAIVYSDDAPDYNLRAAEYLKSEILARTGLELTLVEEETAHENPCELVVGETARQISAELEAPTGGVKFAILATENAVAMEGEAFVIAAAAYFFVETYITTEPFNAQISMETTVHEPIVKEAKNFILLIGDGMGVMQTRIPEVLKPQAEYSDGEEIFYGYLLPNLGYSVTQSLSGVTDSAAGGTALSSGYKTINSYLGLDEKKNEVQTLAELALSLGMSAGVMSTETYTGATPSSFFAHTDSRDNKEDIVLDSAHFTKELGGLINCGYDYYDVKGINTIEKNINNMLDQLDNDEDGFFLMYEEAHIDKHCHSNDIDKTALAVLRFNQAIGVFMEYVFYHPDTFLLITADHETGDMRLNSDRNGFEYRSTGHSGERVLTFSYGTGSELFNGKYVQNVQIATTIASFMGVTDFGDQSQYSYLKK